MNDWTHVAHAGLAIPSIAADATGRGILVSIVDTGVNFDHPHVALPALGGGVEWRDGELKRLDEERRRLDNASAEFETYARELRRAKDREEFDRFMSQRGRRAGAVDADVVQG